MSVLLAAIDPIAFSVGPISVRWYAILIVSAIIIGAAIALKEIERQGLDEDAFLNTLLVAVPCAILGARLYYVIFTWGYYSQHPGEILAIWNGGLAIHGALIGALLAGGLMLYHYKQSVWKVFDVAAPCLALGQAIGRWGNFFNQEAYGYVVDKAQVPWAMFIDGAYRHPTFLYESIWDFALFGFLLWLRRRQGVLEGEMILSYFIIYSLGRVVIENFRTDSLMLGELRAAQLISLLLIAGAGALIIWRRKKGRAPLYELRP
ncbi:MAG: prolipoprotein diacylglyceryl transferase [Syntrophomonadaceae bacterium]|nr:prolipoprotein diacylglyceryl transferase [Syntrophomonadaceae bacterium]